MNWGTFCVCVCLYDVLPAIRMKESTPVQAMCQMYAVCLCVCVPIYTQGQGD